MSGESLDGLKGLKEIFSTVVTMLLSNNHRIRGGLPLLVCPIWYAEMGVNR
jgi:hypothetical protein